MMVKIVDHLDHLVQGLTIDMERKKQENAARQRLETQLYRLLTEMVETERKYVRDLEQVRQTSSLKYFPPLLQLVWNIFQSQFDVVQ